MNTPAEQPITEREAYALGAHARRSFLAIGLNPFPDGSANFAQWKRGWDAECARIAGYANAKISADKRAEWERLAATGARDPDIDYRREGGG